MTTIVVGYVARPEGRAALRRAVVEAKLRSAKLLVVNSNKGGSLHDMDAAVETDADLEQVRVDLSTSGVDYEVRAFVRGQEAPDDLLQVADETGAELIVIGLRKRTPVGKLILGSKAQRILLEARCPVLAVKAESEG
jgi:nucleotide-binding universal stress UspA family protein